MEDNTDFGFQKVAATAKTKLVDELFGRVAAKYDLMNDLMSVGIHRAWKNLAIMHLNLRPGQDIIDFAAGTGDLSLRIKKSCPDIASLTLVDLNIEMLREAQQRLTNQGIIANYINAQAEAIPIADKSCDAIIVSFGFRNFTNKEQALKEFYRILKPGGRLVVLEFSKVINKTFGKFYEWYNFNIIPMIGEVIAKDKASYQYLAESIATHPDQETVLQMFYDANFKECSYINLTNGIVAIHKGFKL